MSDIFEYQNHPEIQGEGTRIVKIEYKNGIQVFLEHYEYPVKGMPTQSAIVAINVVKKLFLAWPRISLRKIEEISWIVIAPHILKSEYMTPIGREIRAIIPSRLGNIIAHVIEYDSAYRLRIQDLFSETSKEKLTQRPFREILRLLKINKQKDYAKVYKKLRRFAFLLAFALLWPPFKRTCREAILQSDFRKLQLDESDKYWLDLRTDYKRKDFMNPASKLWL